MQYSNSGGRLADGNCCDLESGQSCSPTEVCDVQFIFKIENSDSGTRYDSQTLGAGRYDNTNLINFNNCEELPTHITSSAATNPLTYVIPSTDWTGTVSLIYKNRGMNCIRST